MMLAGLIIAGVILLFGAALAWEAYTAPIREDMN